MPGAPSQSTGPEFEHGQLTANFEKHLTTKGRSKRISRRSAGITAGVSLLGATLARSRADDAIEAKLRRRSAAEGLTKADLPTPALLLDLDVFEENIAIMAAHAAAHAKLLRPHAKTHKCAEIARRQMKAVGVCVATVPEAIVMARGGVGEILLASPIASPRKAAQIAGLANDQRTLLVAVDHPQQVELYEQAASLRPHREPL